MRRRAKRGHYALVAKEKDTLEGVGQAAVEGSAIGEAGLLAIPYLIIRGLISKVRKERAGRRE